MSNFIIGYTRGSNLKGIISLKDENKEALKGRWCLYQSSSGVDLSKIICAKSEGECRFEEKKILGNFVRLLDNEDLEKVKQLRQFETKALKICQDLIEKHDLAMKVIRTTLSFDEKRLTFYFVAEERVDFRTLVRDLVSQFHKMIRLQQIGPRDHARIINGIGICGRELCCASFLSEVGKITKDTASLQGMEGLSSDKISGACGKLMCCLKYEVEEYETKNPKSKILISKQAQNTNDQNTKSF
ncbi:hypothetical protein KJ713_00625 [Patescibacteria group bacterium]|nr:hypothetical protein [Patescibacteria group bacterium]